MFFMVKVYPASKSKELEGKFRRLIHNPKKILNKYVKKGDVALDFGCGPGMFSVALADMGVKVISADLQKEMLNKLKNKIKNTKFEKNITLLKCEKNDINLKEKVDFILIFYVLHEIENKSKFIEQIKKIMKKNTKIILVEPLFHVSKNKFEESLEIIEKSGLEIIERPRISLSRSVLLKIK